MRKASPLYRIGHCAAGCALALLILSAWGCSPTRMQLWEDAHLIAVRGNTYLPGWDSIVDKHHRSSASAHAACVLSGMMSDDEWVRVSHPVEQLETDLASKEIRDSLLVLVPVGVIDCGVMERLRNTIENSGNTCAVPQNP